MLQHLLYIDVSELSVSFCGFHALDEVLYRPVFWVLLSQVVFLDLYLKQIDPNILLRLLLDVISFLVGNYNMKLWIYYCNN